MYTENKVVNLPKPKFYKYFTDDIITRRYKDHPNEIFKKLKACLHYFLFFFTK